MPLRYWMKKVIVSINSRVRETLLRYQRDIRHQEMHKSAVIGVRFNELSFNRLAGQHCRIYNDNSRESVVIGDYVLCDGVVHCNSQGAVRIGDHTVINHGVFIAADASITIGKHCFIAREVLLQDNNSHPIDPDRRRTQSLHQYQIPTDTYESERAPIEIGECVWIGTRAIILKGVKIGYGSIVAAGAVVTKAVPPLSIVAGNPARIVKRIEVPVGASSLR